MRDARQLPRRQSQPQEYTISARDKRQVTFQHLWTSPLLPGERRTASTTSARTTTQNRSRSGVAAPPIPDPSGSRPLSVVATYTLGLFTQDNPWLYDEFLPPSSTTTTIRTDSKVVPRRHRRRDSQGLRLVPPFMLAGRDRTHARSTASAINADRHRCTTT